MEIEIEYALNSKFRLLFQTLVDFLLHFKRNMEKNICKAAKILITSRKGCITKTIFKPSHLIKYGLAFNQQGKFRYVMIDPFDYLTTLNHIYLN